MGQTESPPCMCEGCRAEYERLGISMPSTTRKPREAIATNNSKYAVYVMEHIMNTLKVLINLDNPSTTTKFLDLYTRWNTLQTKGKNPGFA